MSTNTQFESYVPVYDVIPNEWQEARPVIVEQLKRISNAVNIREIGWLLDEELLNGQQYIPGQTNSQEFRSVFRKTFEISPVIAGVNTVAHGISITSSFSLIHLYGGSTNAVALTGTALPSGANTLTYDANNVILNSDAAYTRAVIVMEYIQEL